MRYGLEKVTAMASFSSSIYFNVVSPDGHTYLKWLSPRLGFKIS
jgi:hypothetical protein